MLLEVQGLRGIAIIAVLLFHLWPSSFPNGYVGVDMFFVISGYLMALIFSRKPSLNIKTIADFYYKRGKRILPLYYLVIPLILIAGHLFLGPGWIDANNSFGLYSLAILKNMKTIWDGSNYFLAFQATVYQKDIFLHLWSLAVEIQFYLIVPFIFIGLQILRKAFLKIAFLLILSAITCAQYYYSNPIFSFNYFISRMWQFCSGMIAYLATERNAPTEIGKDKQAVRRWYMIGREIMVFFASVPIIIVITPQEVPNELMRPAATLSCFVFLLFETDLSKNFLTTKWLTFCGDISYSLYLVHWPVILLFRNTHSIQFVIGLTVLLAVLTYTYYENFYRKLSMPKVFLLLAFLATFNAFIFLTLMKCPYVIKKLDEFRYPKVDSKELEALKTNLDYSTHTAMAPHAVHNSSSSSFHPQFNWNWGIYDYPKGNGTRKVMLLGNSYVLNQANVIHEEFHGNYSKFKILTGLGLSVFYDSWIPSTPYAGQHEKAMQLVEDFKPDVLFIIIRYDSNMKQLLASSNDPYLQLYRANIGRLEKVSRKILLTGPLPFVPLLHLNSFISTMGESGDLTRYNLNKEEADAEMQPVVPRLKAINCSKCQIYDVKSEFLDGDRYLTYDPQTNVSFFDNDIHLTLAGLERIRPAYTKLIAQLYRWAIPISLITLTVFSIVSLPLPTYRDSAEEVVIGNEPFWFKPSVLEGTYVRDIFRTKDNEITVFFLKDYRNNPNIEIKIGETYYPLTYDCYYPQCQGTFDECSYQDFYGTVKFNTTEMEGNLVTVKLAESKLEHNFKLIDVRSAGTYEHQLGVVLQPAYYLADWQNLIQYFESWLAHGATKFYIYHYSWTRQVDAVVKFYQEKLRDSLEVLPWSAFPVREVDKGRFSADANTRMFNLVSEAAMNNALYRAKGKVKFLAMMDLDELMYVGGGHELIPLLNELDNESPDAAQFSFTWLHSGARISLAEYDSPSDIAFDYLETVKPVTNDSLDTIYFTSRKVIHITDRVEILDTHNTLKNMPNNKTNEPYETVIVDSGRAACYHIRRIFDTLKLRQDKKTALSKHADVLNFNFNKRIKDTRFAKLQMSPWLAEYQTTLMTLHDCRRVTKAKYRKIVRGGLTQCRSVRGCEQFLGGQEHFIFAENSWTNLATRFDILGDIFPPNK